MKKLLSRNYKKYVELIKRTGFNDSESFNESIVALNLIYKEFDKYNLFELKLIKSELDSLKDEYSQFQYVAMLVSICISFLTVVVTLSNLMIKNYEVQIQISKTNALIQLIAFALIILLSGLFTFSKNNRAIIQVIHVINLVLADKEKALNVEYEVNDGVA